MRGLVLWLSLSAFACKPITSATTTIGFEIETYTDAQIAYQHYFYEFSGIMLKYMQDMEVQFSSMLKSGKLNASQQTELKQMLHKVRSFITYAQVSGCLTETKDGTYAVGEKTNSMLCSVLLYKIKELNHQQIDLEQPNEEFFHQRNSKQYNQQHLFAALNDVIIATLAASLRKYQRIFPFAAIDPVQICKAHNTVMMHVPVDVTKLPPQDYRITSPDIASPVFPPTSYPQRQQKNTHCQQLAQQLQQADPATGNELTFTDAAVLQQHVNTVVLNLNATIDRLDRLIHGADGNRPATKKETLLVFPILNTVDFDDSNVVNAYDDYMQVLLAAARDGLLPLLMVYYQQQLHLNMRGAWGGLKAMRYTPLAYPLSRKLEEGVATLYDNLVKRWLALQEKRTDKGKTKEKEIYELLVNNDVAAARLILQDPAYALPVTELFDKYQNDARTPKWLQLFKSWTYRMDMLFLPLTLAAIFVSGGAFVPLVAGIAVSINFFWVGVTGAEAHLARKRYAMMERALLSGNSTQIKRGAQLLRELHDKRRSLVAAGVIGVPLSIPSLKMAVQGVNGFKTLAIDATAAFASDADGLATHSDMDLLGRFEGKSDADLLQEH